jgi:hypothetical protein
MLTLFGVNDIVPQSFGGCDTPFRALMSRYRLALNVFHNAQQMSGCISIVRKHTEVRGRRMRPPNRIAVKIFGVLSLLMAVHPREAVAQNSASVNQADTVLYNGKIVTVDANFLIVQAVAIRDGKFIAVGTDREIQALVGPTTTSIDLRGRTVLPGLIDSHAHLEDAGAAEDTVALGQARTVADALRLIEETAAKTKPGEWIRGGAWRPVSQLAEHRYLTRTEIDSVAPGQSGLLADRPLRDGQQRGAQPGRCHEGYAQSRRRRNREG